ncbi:MAG: hypothetical protein V4568_13805 [Pseudomonadota bacterium]
MGNVNSSEQGAFSLETIIQAFNAVKKGQSETRVDFLRKLIQPVFDGEGDFHSFCRYLNAELNHVETNDNLDDKKLYKDIFEEGGDEKELEEKFYHALLTTYIKTVNYDLSISNDRLAIASINSYDHLNHFIHGLQCFKNGALTDAKLSPVFLKTLAKLLNHCANQFSSPSPPIPFKLQNFGKIIAALSEDKAVFAVVTMLLKAIDKYIKNVPDKTQLWMDKTPERQLVEATIFGKQLISNIESSQHKNAYREILERLRELMKAIDISKATDKNNLEEVNEQLLTLLEAAAKNNDFTRFTEGLSQIKESIDARFHWLQVGNMPETAAFESLKGKNWFNDDAIRIVMPEIFQRHSEGISRLEQNGVTVDWLAPAETRLFLQTEDDYSPVLERLMSKKIVYMPLSDSRANAFENNAEGSGSHLMLIVFDNTGEKPVLNFFNSMPGCGDDVATDISKAIDASIVKQGYNSIEFRPQQCPHQGEGNTWNCGLFMFRNIVGLTH